MYFQLLANTIYSLKPIIMKFLFSLILLLLLAVSCNKDKNKLAGVCYCDFANGEKQEYDLSHLPKSSQIDTCNNHNNNAGHFGGVCKLKD